MDRLPDELLLRVLRRLSSKELIRASRVNRRWQRVTRDKTLWRSLDLSSSLVPFRTLGNYVKNHGVRALILRKSTIKDPLTWVKAFSPNELKTLDLSNANISPRALGHILKSSPHLIILRVPGCNLNSFAYKSIASNDKLRELSISSEKLTLPACKVIFNGCPALETVDLGNNSRFHVLLKHIHWPSLRVLAIKESHLGYSGISNKKIQVLALITERNRTLTKLVKLSLTLNKTGSERKCEARMAFALAGLIKHQAVGETMPEFEESSALRLESLFYRKFRAQ